MARKHLIPDAFSPDELRAWRGFLRTHAALTGQLSEAMVDSAELSLVEYEVLLKLATADDGALPMSRLVTRTYLTLSASGLSRLIDRLRQRDLVTREPCADGDRRSAIVRITSKGRKLWQSAAVAHQERVHMWFLERLTPAEVAQLGDIWDRLLAESAGTTAT